MLPIVTNTPSILNAPASDVLILSVLVTAMVLALVIFREYLNAAGKHTQQWRVDILDIAIVPLLCTFGLLMIMRIVDLVGLG